MARIEKKLNRQIKKYLTEGNDFSEDVSLLRNYLIGQEDAPEESLKILSGFSDFFSAVAETYRQYEDKNKMALRTLDISSQELNGVNRRLEFLNNSMKAILESLGPALLFFNSEGICSPVFSKSCFDLLECDPGEQLIWDVLKIEGDDIAAFQSLISFCFNNESAMSFENIFQMAPEAFSHSGGKIIKLNYRPIYNIAGEIQDVLVIVTDETQEDQFQKLVEERERYSEKIIRLVSTKSSYIQTLGNIEKYFIDTHDTTFRSETSLSSIKEQMHTLKGVSGSFYMESLAEIIHGIEDEIYDGTLDLDTAKQIIEEKVPSIQTSLNEEIEFATFILGDSFNHKEQAREISNTALNEFHRFLKQEQHNDLAHKFFEDFMTVPVFEALKILDFHLQESAKKSGKKVKPCRFTGDNVLIPTYKFDDIIESFIHLVRNAMDHGIEQPQERLKAQKEEEGLVTVNVQAIEKNGNSWMKISFQDDGRGIQTETIKKKLQILGMDVESLSDTDVQQYIFNENLSSRDMATMLSGRGIGLSVVKQKIDDLNGNIDVESCHNKGCTFIIELELS